VQRKRQCVWEKAKAGREEVWWQCVCAGRQVVAVNGNGGMQHSVQCAVCVCKMQCMCGAVCVCEEWNVFPAGEAEATM